MNKIFCIAHKEQSIKLDPSASLVWLGSEQAPDTGHHVLDVNQAYPDLMAWHPFLTGASGTFAIRRFLVDQNIEFSDFDMLTLTQYRKFISKHQFGVHTSSYPTMLFISEEDKIPEYKEWHAIPSKYFLISTPRNIGNTFTQYAHVHQAADFLRYLAIAVELEIITAEECFNLMNNPIIIPGGIELGTFPINIFLSLTAQLEAVCLHFLEKHRPVRLDPYHRRALAFCNERLSSYLLQKVLHEIFDNSIPSDITGFMHTVEIGAKEYRAGI